MKSNVTISPLMHGNELIYPLNNLYPCCAVHAKCAYKLSMLVNEIKKQDQDSMFAYTQQLIVPSFLEWRHKN